MPARPRTPLAAVVLVLGATVLFSIVFSLLHVPSAVLFGSLLGGMTHALTSPTHLQVPPSAFRLGQALIGVTIGSLVSLSALASMGSALLPILAVTIGTVVVSLAAGRLWHCARTSRASRVPSRSLPVERPAWSPSLVSWGRTTAS